VKLFSYVIVRDYGFAPNPFFGECTLAACKPGIRAAAAVGDWVIATGSKTLRRSGQLIYAMCVTETLTLDAYWRDPRFACKRPVLNGSLKQLYGDNIYHRGRRGWAQADSHHSLASGETNLANLERDTGVDRMLLATRFVYFGERAVVIPPNLRRLPETGEDLCCAGRGHRVRSEVMALELVAWLEERGEWGLQGMPSTFRNHRRNAPVRRARGVCAR
jgi:Nucleotide modification associated domain 2